MNNLDPLSNRNIRIEDEEIDFFCPEGEEKGEPMIKQKEYLRHEFSPIYEMPEESECDKTMQKRRPCRSKYNYLKWVEE